MVQVMVRGLILAMLTLALLSTAVYADDGDKHDSDTVIDIGVNGDVKVDIDASGPAELNVGVQGPSEVNIDAGDEVKLNVEASDEPQVFIKGQGIDEPAGYQESGENNPSGDLHNESLNLEEDDVWRWNPYVVIISAAFPVLGVLTFIIIGLL